MEIEAFKERLEFVDDIAPVCVITLSQEYLDESKKEDKKWKEFEKMFFPTGKFSKKNNEYFVLDKADVQYKIGHSSDGEPLEDDILSKGVDKFVVTDLITVQKLMDKGTKFEQKLTAGIRGFFDINNQITEYDSRFAEEVGLKDGSLTSIIEQYDNVLNKQKENQKLRLEQEARQREKAEYDAMKLKEKEEAEAYENEVNTLQEEISPDESLLNSDNEIVQDTTQDMSQDDNNAIDYEENYSSDENYQPEENANDNSFHNELLNLYYNPNEENSVVEELGNELLNVIWDKFPEENISSLTYTFEDNKDVYEKYVPQVQPLIDSVTTEINQKIVDGNEQLEKIHKEHISNIFNKLLPLQEKEIKNISVRTSVDENSNSPYAKALNVLDENVAKEQKSLESYIDNIRLQSTEKLERLKANEREKAIKEWEEAFDAEHENDVENEVKEIYNEKAEQLQQSYTEGQKAIEAQAQEKFFDLISNVSSYTYASHKQEIEDYVEDYKEKCQNIKNEVNQYIEDSNEKVKQIVEKAVKESISENKKREKEIEDGVQQRTAQFKDKNVELSHQLDNSQKETNRLLEDKQQLIERNNKLEKQNSELQAMCEQSQNKIQDIQEQLSHALNFSQQKEEELMNLTTEDDYRKSELERKDKEQRNKWIAIFGSLLLGFATLGGITVYAVSHNNSNQQQNAQYQQQITSLSNELNDLKEENKTLNSKEETYQSELSSAKKELKSTKTTASTSSSKKEKDSNEEKIELNIDGKTVEGTVKEKNGDKIVAEYNGKEYVVYSATPESSN